MPNTRTSAENNIHPARSARLQRRRRYFFTVLFFLTTSGIALFLHALLRKGMTTIEWVILPVFAILYYHLCFSFLLGVFGWFVLTRSRQDPLRLSQTLTAEEEDTVPLASTAIVIPLYNEDVTRVFEGLRIMYRSLEKTGQLAHFDFFLLSDSDDSNKWVEEEVAWLELCKQLDGLGKIFYRKRRQAINRKSGNIADFCRRWGARYRYMIVLDADSLLGGSGLVRLVRLMEKNPQVGMIQTLPKLIRGETLFARVMQFSHRLYGPLFTAGLDYWQGHDAIFWGHNAIIRLQPFIEFCSLPDLPGKEPLGGRILSHDYVECALMRKAGYQVCYATDIEESYEEGPPNLVEHLKRDRRWCQGNLQHLFLLQAKGWSAIHRLNFYQGILNYVVSPVWFLFLILCNLLAIAASQFPEDFNFHPHYHILMGMVAVFLFFPKLAANCRILFDRTRVAEYGGRFRAMAGMLLEIPFFIVLAPILMISHTKFVVLTILGQGVRWVAQKRTADGEVDWQEAILHFYKITLLGLIWGICAYVIDWRFFLYLLPVVVGLVGSIPFHIITGSTRLGQSARRMGLFCTPEELQPVWVVSQLESNLAKAYRRQIHPQALSKEYGLTQAIIDPYINALHVSLLRQRQRPPPESEEFFQAKRVLLLEKGPEALEAKEKLALLYHAESLLWLNDQIWSTPQEKMAAFWQLALRQYNQLTPEPVTPLYR